MLWSIQGRHTVESLRRCRKYSGLELRFLRLFPPVVSHVSCTLGTLQVWNSKRQTKTYSLMLWRCLTRWTCFRTALWEGRFCALQFRHHVAGRLWFEFAARFGDAGIWRNILVGRFPSVVFTVALLSFGEGGTEGGEVPSPSCMPTIVNVEAAILERSWLTLGLLLIWWPEGCT